MGRLGVPADYQDAVVFLASDASSYATGHDSVRWWVHALVRLVVAFLVSLI